MSVKPRRESWASERGQVIVFFAILLPVLLALSAVVIGLGNWFVHVRHLQTKADAGALAGGSAWSFPCEPSGNTDTTIVNNARLYAGTRNPQVGGVPDSSITSVLNGPKWYDNDSEPAPSQFTSPGGSVCEAKILDVKVTEDDSFPLASLIPLFPDLKRKARVEIQEGNGLSGLLPIAVRVPKPLSAAAIYIDETPLNFGRILATRYFNDVCEPPGFTRCIDPLEIPSGLDHWTTDDGSLGNRADITNMPSQVGVVIAVSFRPACPGVTRCFDIDPVSFPGGVDELCNQGTGAGIVQCFYTTQSSGTQTVQSGLQFIRGYGANPDPAPDLLSVWLDTPIGTNCTQGYFSAPVNNPCDVMLHASIDPGAAAGGGAFDIRYKLVSGNTSWQQDDAPGACNANFGASCTLSAGSTGQISIQLDESYARHAVAIQIRLGNLNPVPAGFPAQCAGPPSNACSWYFTGAARTFLSAPTNQAIFANPVQRGFMGNLALSGPVKYLHLYNVDCNNGSTIAGFGVTGEAASVQTGRRCFKLEMGLQGALAREQDEVPIQLNIGATSQSAVVDCDPDIPNLKEEIVQGCGGADGWPTYKKHDFAATPYCPGWNGINNFFSLPKPSPWQGWAPFTCVATQTTATPNQVVQGFNERFFGVTNNPTCPADNAQFVPGRNYWHDLNNDFFGDPDEPDGPEIGQVDYFTFTRTSRNHGNKLRNDDKRFVLMYVTPYNSFTGNGNEIYPITLIGGFYITGYGRILGNGNLINEDPCATGAGTVGAGNTPPPDVDTSTAGAVAWGHFVVPVSLGTSSGGTGQLCQEGTPTACVVVMVE